MTLLTLKRDVEATEQDSVAEFANIDVERDPNPGVPDKRWPIHRMLALSAVISVLLWALLGLLVWEGLHAF